MGQKVLRFSSPKFEEQRLHKQLYILNRDEYEVDASSDRWVGG
jgi:hypothetical protein